MFPDLTILIPAAGSGKRLGMGPKALLERNNRPLIFLHLLPLCFILFIWSFGHAQTDPKILFDRGVEKLKQGMYQDAVDLFSELIIAVPDNAKAFKNRGVALMNLGKMDHAINDFQSALAIDPNLKGLHSNLGAAWYYKGEHEKAIHSYSMAVKENPESHIAYFNRALSRMALNRFEGAIEDLKQILELNPEFDPAVTAMENIRKQLAGSGETYTVQIGAFISENNALGLKQRFLERGLDARVITFRDEDERTWHRVVCGKNLTREKARILRDKLENEYAVHPIIRPEH